jgi:hypothetical protein
LRGDRYSPYGVEGLYFGLCLEAAEDEARYYGQGKISEDESMILVIDCSFDNVLYLTCGVLPWIWQAVGLPEAKSSMDMYLRLLDPRTDNPVTNAIGTWARDAGFEGLIYPSARYGQDEYLAGLQKKGFHLVPGINFVDLGSHVCRAWPQPVYHVSFAVAEEIERLGGYEKCVPVLANQNIVLFDSGQIQGDNRAVFYQTFPVSDREAILRQEDQSRFARSYMYWLSDDNPPYAKE